MKQFLLLAGLVLCAYGLSAQTVFVDADATGNNDGTSWADAYTNLNDALLAAPAGASVWVAEGAYVTPDTASFFIDKELTLLGGFDGSETNADEADPSVNSTVLSGDVDGNDGMTYDSLTAADNNRVLLISDTSSIGSQFSVTVADLTITNGAINTNIQDADPSLIPFAGGGILALANVNISRVTFLNNRAEFGRDLAVILDVANGSTIDDITVSEGYVNTGRSVYLNSSDDVTIQNCVFDSDDIRESGFVQAAFCDGLTIQDSEFNNLAAEFSGGGIRLDNCDDVTIRNTEFDNLSANQGAAIYANQNSDFEVEERDENDLLLDNVTITDCITPAGQFSRGALGIRNGSFRIVDSELTDNSTNDIGGAIYQVTVDSREYTHVIENSIVSDNTDAGAGGAVCVLVITPGQGGGPSSVRGRYVNTTFEDNVSSDGNGSGGVAYFQGDHVMEITDCIFEGNAAGTGSAIQSQTAGGQAKVQNELNISGTVFEENGDAGSSFRGGAITMFVDDGAGGLIIDSTQFLSNQVTNNAASFSAGGAILFVGGELEAIPFKISNSLFQNNAATDGRSGGVIYSAFAMDLDVDNTDFITNSAGGSGGVITIQRGVALRDTSDTGEITTLLYPVPTDFKDCAFISNRTGVQGGAISTFGAGVDLTNCVFADNSTDDSEDGVSGGAIIINGNSPSIDATTGEQELGEDGLPVRIGSAQITNLWVHNTFLDNRKGGNPAAVGDAAAFYQTDNVNAVDTNSITVTLLNNAFLSSADRTSLAVEPDEDDMSQGLRGVGEINIISLGGNFFNTANGLRIIEQIGDAENDLTDESITDFTDLFVDPTDELFEGVNLDLIIPGNLEDNPLINNGVQNELVPEEDIRGNPRGVAPDIGAFEADQGAVSVAEPISESGLQLELFPNPTADYLNIRNGEATISHFNVVVCDVNGRVMTAKAFSGTNNALDLTALPKGVYNLQLVVDGKAYSHQVVKQ